MPKQLEKHLPALNATERADLFGSITTVTALPFDDPTRQGVIAGTHPSPLSAPSLSLYIYINADDPRPQPTATRCETC